MEAQPPPQPTPPPLSSILPPPHLNYPDSLDSSPRSRNTDSWDEPYPPPPPPTTNTKLRLMISYGGHIAPRPHDKSLCYLGGDTRIILIHRHTSLSDLSTRLSKTFLQSRPFLLKYQLPTEDLDSLISVTTDEDLENMIDEYDRTSSSSSNSSKPSRIRLFLFPAKPDQAQPIGPVKPDDWFLNSLSDGALSESASLDCLLGFDEVVGAANNNLNNSNNSNNNINMVVSEAQPGNGGKSVKQEVQSVQDSPMLETNSSFGSTSSSPSLANLPPIRVHVDEVGGGGGVRVQDQKVMGIEEQFAQLGVGGGGDGGVGQKQDEGFGEYPNRVVSDDERSDHGVPVGNRKQVPTSQPQNQTQTQSQNQAQGQALNSNTQFQQKSSGGVDLPSPDSVSSDSSLSNPMSRQKPVIYQDQVQIESGSSRVPSTSVDPKLNVSDPQGRIQLQQLVPDPGYVLKQQFDQQQQQFGQQQLVPDPGYVLNQQFDQQQQQFDQQQQQFGQQQLVPDPRYVLNEQFDQQQQQFDQQQQQFGQQQLVPDPRYVLNQQFDQQQQQFGQQQQQQVQQQPQFMHGTHFIHHTPSGPVSIPAYYTVYPSQQQTIPQHHHQLDQQYPVYYVHARQPQAYNLAESATAIPASRPQNPPNHATVPPSAAYNTIRNAPLPNSEMTAAAYRMATGGNPQLVQVPNSQHQQQYVAYSQIHHPSQSMAPNSAAPANYAYEFADPAHAQIFYAQHLAPTIPSQYQTMTAAAVGLPEGSAQLPSEGIKQQVRTSQQ